MNALKTAAEPAIPTNPAKAIANLRGHTGGIITLAFSPDRCLLASASRDGTGRVWEVASKRPGGRGTFRYHGDPFHAVAFSPDSRRLAAGSGTQSGSVRLYDVSEKAPQEVCVLRGGAGSVEALAFSPDGKLVAGGGADRTLRVWDCGPGSKGDARALLPGHTGPIRALTFAPDGYGIATASADATVRLWSISRIRSWERAMLPHEREVDSVVYSPDGKTLATASGGSVRLWDLTSVKPTVRAELHASAGVRLVFITPDDVVIGAGTGSQVFNWDLRTGLPIREWELPAGVASGLALTVDGRYLGRGNGEGHVDVYRVAEKRT